MTIRDGLRRSNFRHDGPRIGETTPLIDSTVLRDPTMDKDTNDSRVGVSWGVAAFLLVNTALGAGMLNYPSAYNEIGGLWVATCIQIILLVFIISTMFILVYCADFNQDDTYHDVLLSMCGKRAQQVSAVSILLTCYGINITFLVIIGDQFDRIFNSHLPHIMASGYWYLDRKFTISATSILFIWPMCYARRLEFLKHASILGLFAMLYVAFLTVYEHHVLDEDKIAVLLANRPEHQINSTLSHHQTGAHTNKLNMVYWFQSLAVVPVLCFAYQTHEVIVPVYACMKQRAIGHFMKASTFGLIILFFLYNLVGAFGYLTFGSHVDPDIMSLYDAKDPVVVVGIVALVIKFITTYPPLMFCGRSAIEGLYGEFRRLSPEQLKSSERTRRIVISTGWFVSTVILAVFAPDISVTLQLLGSMAAVNVFIFPGMCLISLTRRLRRARMNLLTDEADDYGQHHHQQRAKGYYLVSGTDYFNQLKRDAIRRNAAASHANQHLSGDVSCTSSQRHNYTPTTFASLIEFDNDMSNNTASLLGEHSGTGNGSLDGPRHKINGYGTQLRSHKRPDDHERFISNGNYLIQDQPGQLGRGVNESYNDCNEIDLSQQNQKCDLSIYPSLKAPNKGASKVANGSPGFNFRAPHDNESGISSYNNRDQSLDRVGHSANHCLSNQFIQASWINRSTTGSVLERLGSSIAPSVVAQTGISRWAALGLYIFSGILIIFGGFVFVLELVTVTGIV